MTLVLSERAAAILQKRMILEEDARRVIAHAEATGDRVEDPTSGHFTASLRPANVTFWVEYSPGPSGFVVHNAYSHRMDVAIP